MRVITEQRLIELRAKYAEDLNIKDGCLIDDLIHDELVDIDQLIVTKLRPISEAPKTGQNILLKHKMFFGLYEACFVSGKWSHTIPTKCNLLDDNSFDGWIPIPVYKPEEA